MTKTREGQRGGAQGASEHQVAGNVICVTRQKAEWGEEQLQDKGSEICNIDFFYIRWPCEVWNIFIYYFNKK